MSSTFFFNSTSNELDLILRGHEEEVKYNYFINLSMTINAIGSCFGGKKFKAEHPFDAKEVKRKPKSITKEEMKNELEEIQERFNKKC